jgi:SAM-dependent methyltransferase
MKLDGDWYDYPQYFDLAFRDETEAEVEFFLAAFEQYATIPVQRLYEPGCGSGRLVIAMAERGYELVGLDLNRPSLEYLKKKLRRRKAEATLVEGDMRNHRVTPCVDAAFCTFNTFRQLTTEQDAIAHLRSVAASLNTGGIYILGFHIIPLDAEETCKEVWRASHGRSSVTVTLKVMDFNRRKRLEQIRICLLGRTGDKTIRCRTDYPMRLYTANQVDSLFRSVPEFEVVGIHDFDYEIEYPLELDDDLTDAVFVLRKI